jgi:DNA topoisomerase-1
VKKTDKLLIIVESPNKCKTITDIVKKAGYTSAKVAASVGHIVELGNGGPAFNSGIYPDEAFKMNLKVSEDKKKVVSDLKDLVKWADIVLLMTDPDREGYVIADTLINFLKIPSAKCLRAVTH